MCDEVSSWSILLMKGGKLACEAQPREAHAPSHDENTLITAKCWQQYRQACTCP